MAARGKAQIKGNGYDPELKQKTEKNNIRTLSKPSVKLLIINKFEVGYKSRKALNEMRQ